MRCTVFGTGYLGATHAAGMAELGHDVLGVDIDAGKVGFYDTYRDPSARSQSAAATHG